MSLLGAVVNVPAGLVRRRVWEAVDARIGGPGANERRRSLREAVGDRLFADDSPVRTVHGDFAMLGGGVRAVLLQSLHPVAMWAVAEHSQYRQDPWGRLQRTAAFLGAVTFGTTEQAEAAIARVRSVHERIRGTTPDGTPYRADDPHLLAWVHVAEVDSFVRAHQRYGSPRLTEPEVDRYVAEMAIVGEALGAAGLPRTWRGVQQALADLRPELRGTPPARRVAQDLLVPPGLSPAERFAYAPIVASGIGLLPEWARRALRILQPPGADALLVQPAFRAVLGLVRWASGAATEPRLRADA